jgi:hypothetical protein
MATNIDKALYQNPVGIEQAAQQEEPIEIEIVDPEAVNIHAGPLDISITPDEDGNTFDENLAETLSEGELNTLAGELSQDITNDLGSRTEWEKSYVAGLKLLGLQYEERTEPWDGACGVFHPMITEAVVRFQSESITETFPAQGPVKTKILGKQTPEKDEAATRVQDDMNYELTEVMKEFRPEHERMLWSLPATGSAFKKVYYDPNIGRQVSMFIPAEDIILPYGATDLDTCYRVTHVLRKTKSEIIKLQQAGFYRDIVLPDPDKSKTDIQQAKDKETGFSDLNDDRYTLYESHVDLVIRGDQYTDTGEDGEPLGITLPYVMTVLKGSNDVLSIRRNWKEDDPLRLKRQHFVHYQYIPGFGAYGFGLFHLIGGFAKSATSIMRQLVDAGTLSNLPGGLKTRGLRIKGDDTPIAPGEFRDVDIGSGALRDNILPLPYKEPSATLYQLLNNIVEEGRRFAATADMQVSDMSAQAPVGTTLALLERQLKVMTAVSARLHFSFKQELKLLAGLIRDYTDDKYDYDPENATRKAKAEDYHHVEIIPVSDPNAATMSQRVVQYQAVIQMAQMAPDIYNLPKLHRGMLEVLGIKNAADLVPLPDDQKPKDPVSENAAVLKGEPVKAFFYQDHQSHIQVHMAMMQDPIIAQLIGQNPQAPKIQAAMMAHIADHVGLAYRQKIEQQLGMPLPPEDEKMPPEIETQLSAMMAQAANQVLQQSQAQVAQAQAQQQAQDPVMQMQQQELQIKQQQTQIQAQKVQGDLAIKQQELQLKAQEAAAKQQQSSPQLAAMKAQQELQNTALRQHQELQANAARLRQDVAGERAKRIMDAQAHAQNLVHRQQQHVQNLEHQRAQAQARVEQMRNPKEKPTK